MCPHKEWRQQHHNAPEVVALECIRIEVSSRVGSKDPSALPHSCQHCRCHNTHEGIKYQCRLSMSHIGGAQHEGECVCSQCRTACCIALGIDAGDAAGGDTCESHARPVLARLARQPLGLAELRLGLRQPFRRCGVTELRVQQGLQSLMSAEHCMRLARPAA